MSLKARRVGEFFASALVEDLDNRSDYLATSIYGPTGNQRRDRFWNDLDEIRVRWNGLWCVGGDFNVIRFSDEKLGS